MALVRDTIISLPNTMQINVGKNEGSRKWKEIDTLKHVKGS